MNAPSPTTGGLILAGGASARFGREKAMARLDGRPLIDWVAAALAGDVGVLAVSARTDSGAAAYARQRGWPVLQDEGARPGGAGDGPLAGVLAGLRWADAAGARWLCTAPCDTPFLPENLVEVLVAAAGAGGAVARTAQGLQPLVALWPVAALTAVAGWRGRRAPRDVLQALGAAPVDFADAHAFANLNTPQDYAAARGAAASRLR